MKRCPYCGYLHSRPRAKFCCEHHSRKFHSFNGAQTARYNRIAKATMAKARRRAKHRPLWRGAATGNGYDAALLTIFGVDSATVTKLTRQVRGGCAVDIVP